jgi:hypothetical protein
LRRDQRLLKPEESRVMQGLQLAVVDLDDGVFGRALVEALHQALPQLRPDLILVDQLNVDESVSEIAARLGQADAIVGPWTLVSSSARGFDGSLLDVLQDNSTRKVLIPTHVGGWEWVGVPRLDTEALVKHSVKAVKQIAAGEEVRTARRLGLGAIIGIVIGAAAALPLMLGLVIAVLFYFFY